MNYRNAPPYSCPDFDEAISYIERARSINRKLRDDNSAFESDLEEANATIAELRARVASLEARLEQASSVWLEVPDLIPLENLI